jgi:Protein of unknown function (DUF3618)
VGEDPDRIRQEIEQTRAEMSETVDALEYKTDVKSRTKEKVVGATQSVKDKVVGAKDSVAGTAGSVGGTVSDATPDRQQVAANARRAQGMAQENPLGFAIGSIAVGFIAGMLVPATRVEDEKLGQISDQVTDKVKQTGQEALEHGKEVVKETAQDAQSTLQESAQRHGEQVGETAKEHAQEVRS